MKTTMKVISVDLFSRVGDTCETHLPAMNYWLGDRNHESAEGGGHFVIDLGCCVTVSLVRLVNTYNQRLNYNERLHGATQCCQMVRSKKYQGKPTTFDPKMAV